MSLAPLVATAADYGRGRMVAVGIGGFVPVFDADESALAATGRQANASRASTDRSEKTDRFQAWPWWRLPNMARKVRGKRGVFLPNFADRGSGADGRGFRA